MMSDRKIDGLICIIIKCFAVDFFCVILQSGFNHRWLMYIRFWFCHPMVYLISFERCHCVINERSLTLISTSQMNFRSLWQDDKSPHHLLGRKMSILVYATCDVHMAISNFIRREFEAKPQEHSFSFSGLNKYLQDLEKIFIILCTHLIGSGEFLYMKLYLKKKCSISSRVRHSQ